MLISVAKGASALARILQKLAPENREVALAWAAEKAQSPAKKRRKRKAKASAPAPSPAPRKLVKPVAPAKRLSRRAKPEPEDEPED